MNEWIVNFRFITSKCCSNIVRGETICSPPFFFLNHRICRPHPRCWRPSKPCGLKTSPGTQQVSRWQRLLTGSARVLLLTTQAMATRSVAPGRRSIIIPPRSDHGGKPAAGGPAPFGARIPGSFPGKRWSLGAAALAARVSWRSRRVRSRSRECTCCAGIQFSNCLPAGRRGLLSFAFANLLILL